MVPDREAGGTCNCDDKTVTFSIPTNPTSRPQALTINNQTYVVLPGQALTKTVPMTGTVTVSVGVQKASGAWLTQQQVQINA